ncbi:hypothetical protein QVE09_29935, partial [Paenibacillus sp. ClWae2A]|uniref:hypothetical protein n=1 Tax=Paenibacillus sp. ClWae2A TaxID=3057177 RepID=UPI0028F64B3B
SFSHRFWRLKSDAKLAPAAPSSPSLLVHLGAAARSYRARWVTTSLRAFLLARSYGVDRFAGSTLPIFSA